MNKYVPLYPEDVAKFGVLPSAVIDKGRDRIGGRILHMPCPKCGGVDRFNCSNGICVCRKCGYGFNVAKKLGEGIEKRATFTRAELDAMIAKEQEKIAARSARVRRYLNSGVVERLHANLLRSQEALAFLEKQWKFDATIAARHLLGYDPNFSVVVSGKAVKAPAIIFPHIFAGKVLAATARITDTETANALGKYRPWRKMGRAVVYPLIGGHKHSEYIVIVEGAAKAIRVANDLDIDVIAVSGVNQLSKEKGEKTIKWLKRHYNDGKNVRVLFDEEDNTHVVRAAIATAHRVGGVALRPIGKPDDMLVEGKWSAEDLLDYIVKAEEVLHE